MAKMRKFVAYRRLERPYTRKSKYRRYMYVRGSPHCKIVRYVMGNRTRVFPYAVKLVAESNLQVRHNALESIRMTANRRLEGKLARSNFFFRIHKFPHHVLRENALASGAGADRLSTGMKKSFGKAISVAAQVRRGDVLCEIGVEEKGIPVAKDVLRAISSKLPNSYAIVVRKQKTGSTERSETKVRL